MKLNNTNKLIKDGYKTHFSITFYYSKMPFISLIFIASKTKQHL